MFHNGYSILYHLCFVLCQIYCVYLGSTFGILYQNVSEGSNQTEPCNGTEIFSAEQTEEPTFFEKLDETIYRSLSNPQPGAANKLFADIEMFRNCLRRVRRMYMEMEGEKIESLRNSVVQLYTSKGGPTFTRFSPYQPENKQKLLDVFKWTEENINKLHKIQEESENIWYAVRHIVI